MAFILQPLHKLPQSSYSLVHYIFKKTSFAAIWQSSFVILFSPCYSVDLLNMHKCVRQKENNYFSYKL